MSLEIDKKQKLMLELCISDIEIFSKTIKIMDQRYFDKPLDRVVAFIKKYYTKHKGIPSSAIIEADTAVLLEKRDIEHDEKSYVLEELERFCQESAMGLAITDSVDLINAGELSAVSELVRKALMVKIDDSVGLELFTNAQERIETTDESTDQRSTGIKEFDKLINYTRRGEVGVVFGGSGTGKSVMLGNFARNYSKQGLHGIVISLELKEKLYAKRMDTIFTGFDISKHKESANDIAEFYENNSDGMGSVVVKFLKAKSNANDIRTVLMQYELKYKRKPDFIMVDYLALMGLCGGNELAMNKFDADEYKIFDLQAIATDYNSYLITAGQLNRDGTDVIDIMPKHVAGGLSVVNGSDWSVAMVATEEDLDNNQFQVKQLKIRNGAKTRKPIMLYRCEKSLRVSDAPIVGQSPVVERTSAATKSKPAAEKETIVGKAGKAKLNAALKRLNS